MKNKLIYWLIWLSVLILLILCVSIFSLCVGSADISFRKIFSLNLAKSHSTAYTIIFNIRLPRIILGFAIGGALSLAGVILQGMFRNPLVEPYTLGISGGAALGVCLNAILGLNSTFGILSIPIFGFSGAVLVIIFVYFLSLKKGVLRIQGLLLTGVMISFIASSLIMFLMAISGIEDLHGIIFWIMGSLEEPNWMLIKLILILSICGLVISYFFCFDLNALSLGEEEALHLGVNVERTKKSLFLLASLLTGFSVSVAGIIGFIGLVVPHFMRMFVGQDHRILLISSFLAGASFLIFSDTIARTIILPLELPVGVITGIVGGSLFIYVLAKKEFIFWR
ncbi:MAG: iron ABC transporter permease [Candidatus Omnitrophica bacterium]|nr:iron ABC transporter permease [Candidatus Omnitrophota bacterium]